MKPWLKGRLALSQQNSRFEIPMDVRLLESECCLFSYLFFCLSEPDLITSSQNIYFKFLFFSNDSYGISNEVLCNKVSSYSLCNHNNFWRNVYHSLSFNEPVLQQKKKSVVPTRISKSGQKSRRNH